MPYHPSQQIAPEHETLYTKAILESILTQPPMLGHLTASECFSFRESTPSNNLATLHFNQKLGHLYEEALNVLLQDNRAYDVLANNLQLITEEKRTIGELDFLLKHNDLLVHLELAVKFYLIHKLDGEEHYPGPDARDNYHSKLERLESHQLQLTRKTEVKELIKSYTHEDPIHVQHLVHGIFFDHIEAEDTPLPDGASPIVRRRKWLHCCELPSSTIQSVRVIPKPLWLCEISEELFETLVEVERDELIELAQQRCTMCIEQPNSEPYFVAPDLWPNH